MFEVKERNIREAYDLLKFMTSDPAVAEKKGKTAIYVADLKRAIRAYTNRPAPDGFMRLLQNIIAPCTKK